MLADAQDLLTRLDLPTELFLMIGFGMGLFLVAWGLISAFARTDPAAARIASIAQSRRQARLDRALLKAPDAQPGGLMRAFVPADGSERGALRQKLAQAGFPGPRALRNFTLVRILLGLVLPGGMLTLVVLGRTPGMVLPFGLTEYIGGFSNLAIYNILTILIAIGFFGPSIWLNSRVTERRRRIEESFPNALDLMQISIESGLGFDSAMTRVGNELAEISPDIAYEFLTVQHQVQAGRAREAAMADMAERTGVETVRSFANVAHQSMQFGTSMAQALTTYSEDLRQHRELRAQEMANKLPVKMSAVLAALMLPALILLTVGPVVIRYVRMFG